MDLVRGLANLRPRHKGCVATLGAFDGLHLGHRALVAEALSQAASRSRPAIMLSFEPMPREYLNPQAPPARLTNFRERWRLLEHSGLDALCLLRFGEPLRSMSGEAFLEMLRDELEVAALVVGHDFRFGRTGAATAATMHAAGARMGFGVTVLPAVLSGADRASSSAVREALAAGDFDRAASMLGRRYTMRGRIVAGERLGRRLGYPTANMRIDRRRSPLGGIFAVRAHGIAAQALPAVASLGTRPTIDGVEPLLETHVFDFDGDLYGREIEVEFVQKLRDEARFDDLDALVAQMNRDAVAARGILAT
jgi:riboflavin kinase / FMN adenylyltransferase